MRNASWAPVATGLTGALIFGRRWVLFYYRAAAGRDPAEVKTDIGKISERAKPEQSGDAKPRIPILWDGRVAEEMRNASWHPAIKSQPGALIFGRR